MIKVAIIVLNYNGRKYIGKCLDKLRNIEKKDIDLETWVVDNASNDNSVDYIRKEFAEFKLVVNEENQGYAEGNNIGIRHALAWGADWIWIVNPDIEVKKDALVQLIKFVATRPKVGIVGSKVYYTLGFETHPERYQKKDLGKVIWYAGGEIDWDNVFSIHLGLDEVDSGKYNTQRQVEFLTGSSMLVRAKMLQQIGHIDAKYFLYYEENDLCQRALKHGWQLWYIPQSIVWHANAQATRIGSPLVDYYTTRNRMLFGMRWAPFKTKMALVRESIGLMFFGRKWQKIGVADFYLCRFGKGSYRAD